MLFFVVGQELGRSGAGLDFFAKFFAKIVHHTAQLGQKTDRHATPVFAGFRVFIRAPAR
jgi:hypothetical protein